MNCPYCGLTLMIMGSQYKTVNDDTPDKPTELYLVQELMCRNPQCKHNGEIVNTVEHKIDL